MSCRKQGAPIPRILILFRRSYTDTLTVIVGEHSELFTVHVDRICEASPFFAAACSKQWIEGRTRIVRLPEQSAEYFRDYIDWVYSHQVNLKELKCELAKAENTEKEPKALIHAYCEIWVIADYLRDSACKNACLLELVNTRVAEIIPFPYSETVVFVADNVAESSGLFVWMVERVAQALVASFRCDQEEGFDQKDYIEALPETLKNAILKETFTAIHPLTSNNTMDASRYQEKVEP